MPSPKAVLFDFDGVIADTENVHVAAWERVFARMGLDVSPDQCVRSAEIDDRDFLTKILASKKIEEGAVEGWVGRKQELTEMMLKDQPSLYPGVVELIQRLEGRASLGIVSTARRADIELVLKAGGIAGAFAVIVAKEDVSATKPDPESYRTALELLAVSREEVVAIEDSATGLSAAESAGVRCLAVGHKHANRVWAGDSLFLEDLADTGAVLAVLGFEDV